MTRAFGALRTRATEGVKRRRLFTRVGARLRDGLRASAFSGWRDRATESRRRRMRVSRFLTRWSVAAAASAFSTWRTAWRRATMARRAAGFAVARARVRVQAPAFRRWREYFRRSRSVDARLDDVLERRRRRVLDASLTAWSDAASRERRRRRLGAQRASTFLRRVERRALRDHADAWLVVATRARTRAASRRGGALARVDDISPRRSRDGPSGPATRVLFDATSRVRSREPSRRPHPWRFAVGAASLASPRLREEESSRASSRDSSDEPSRKPSPRGDASSTIRVDSESSRDASSRISDLGRSRARFDAWLSTAASLRRDRATTGRVVARMRRARLGAAWRGWTRAIRRERRLRLVAYHVVRRVTDRLATEAFDAWAETTAEARRERWALGRAGRARRGDARETIRDVGRARRRIETRTKPRSSRRRAMDRASSRRVVRDVDGGGGASSPRPARRRGGRAKMARQIPRRRISRAGEKKRETRDARERASRRASRASSEDANTRRFAGGARPSRRDATRGERWRRWR